jgi:hypothetical protein
MPHNAVLNRTQGAPAIVVGSGTTAGAVALKLSNANPTRISGFSKSPIHEIRIVWIGASKSVKEKLQGHPSRESKGGLFFEVKNGESCMAITLVVLSSASTRQRSKLDAKPSMNRPGFAGGSIP